MFMIRHVFELWLLHVYTAATVGMSGLRQIPKKINSADSLQHRAIIRAS